MISGKPRRMVPRSFFWNRKRNKIARLIELAMKRDTDEMLDQDHTALIRDPQWLLIQQLIVDRCGRKPRAEYEEITLAKLFKCIDQNRLDLWQAIVDISREWATDAGIDLLPAMSKGKCLSDAILRQWVRNNTDGSGKMDDHWRKACTAHPEHHITREKFALIFYGAHPNRKRMGRRARENSPDLVAEK